MRKGIVAVIMAATIFAAGCGDNHSEPTTAQKCIDQWEQTRPTTKQGEPAWLLKCARTIEAGK